MPNPFLELPLSNELFNKQQDDGQNLPSQENIEGEFQFSLENEFTGVGSNNIYEVSDGIYESLNQEGAPILVATYGREITIKLTENYTREQFKDYNLEGVRWKISRPGQSGYGSTSDDGVYNVLQDYSGYGGGASYLDPTTLSITLSSLANIDYFVDTVYVIKAFPLVIPQSRTEGPPDPEYFNDLPEFEFVAIPTPASEDEPNLVPKFSPFVANITAVSNDTITINQSWSEFKEKIGGVEQQVINPESEIYNWTISYKINDKRDLNTYLHFGDGRMQLVTNVKTDHETFPDLPYSAVYKLYEPLPEDINEKDNTFIVREILPQHTEMVELIPYEREEDVLVLKIPDNPAENSPIVKRETELKNYNDLITTDKRLKQEIVDKYLKGAEKPVDLNVEYSNYENFVNFSSAEKRLNNFKYKIEQIEENSVNSSSFSSITGGERDVLISENKIRDIKNNFDGYENYLYGTNSTFVTSSMGEFPNASWPKTGSGSYAEPFKPVSSSSDLFLSWYGSKIGKTGQIYSASLYDTNNPNRLVNLLPTHIKDDSQNKEFLDFMDMIGQHFDELWSYTKALSEITDRQSDLSEGFSKDLIYNLAKSLGWDTNDGKDLLDLSRDGFGQKVSGSVYSLYTSGSADSPPEGDVSKEITKRLIASMPYILKSKGTVGSLKGLLNCYGIPSSILRVREYGGLDQSKETQRQPFEISRKFTKALGFRGDAYVTSSWDNDSRSGRKPETVEMRFRSVSGSDQTLVQKNDNWAISLKDNGSTDNYGTVAFSLSGSDGYKTVSSSLLPVFDGDYYSVMLQKTKVDVELFPFPSFNTSSLFNPPFITGSDGQTSSAEYGNIQIVSSSNVARTGTKSLRHINSSPDNVSYTHLFKVPEISGSLGSQQASVASVSTNETYTLSAYAKVSSSVVNSVGRLRIFELDENENVTNWDEDVNKNEDSISSIGGIKTSPNVGLDEVEWRQISVTKTIRMPNTTKLGIRFENVKPDTTIYWDDVSLRKGSSNTDTIADAFNYDLFVKKYEAGLDRIIYSARTSLTITGSNTNTQSYNASWTGSGDLYIGGKPSDEFGSQLTGSIMEFRLWNEPLKEQHFDTHVENPKSYIGNTPSSSYYSLVRRYSFDDNTTLSNGDNIRDVSSDQTDTVPGYAFGFGGLNTFENVEDKTKTMVPNYGPNRRTSTKIRIENNVLSGSSAMLSRTERFDFSSNDFAPLDSPKVGIYFSPVDVVNQDIILSFANLDFNKYLGDPRDNFKLQYPELRDISNEYFQKYSGRNNFWDYMHLIKYYDQSVFRQIKKLIPARSKPHLGTVIEPNIFERSKSPVQRNHPSFTLPQYEKTINLTNFHYNADPNNEESQSVLQIKTEYPFYEGEIDKSLRSFELPSLYNFGFNDNFSDNSIYVSASAEGGGPNYVFTEATGAMATQNRLSETNQEYKFFYSSSVLFDASRRYGEYSIDPNYNLYYSRSLHESDLDPGYQNVTAFRRLFYEGVKNTKSTTIDGDYPVIIRTTSPTVAVPSNVADSNLKVVDDKLK